MQPSHRDHIDRAFLILHKGLSPFVQRHLDLRSDDPKFLLATIIKYWDRAFRGELKRTELSYLHELHEIRNMWAHHAQLSWEDAERTLDTVARLLNSIGASDEAESARKLRLTILRQITEGPSSENEVNNDDAIVLRVLAAIEGRFAQSTSDEHSGPQIARQGAPAEELVSTRSDFAFGKSPETEVKSGYDEQGLKSDRVLTEKMHAPKSERTFHSEHKEPLLLPAAKSLQVKPAAPKTEVPSSMPVRSQVVDSSRTSSSKASVGRRESAPSKSASSRVSRPSRGAFDERQTRNYLRLMKGMGHPEAEARALAKVHGYMLADPPRADTALTDRGSKVTTNPLKPARVEKTPQPNPSAPLAMASPRQSRILNKASGEAISKRLEYTRDPVAPHVVSSAPPKVETTQVSWNEPKAREAHVPPARQVEARETIDLQPLRPRTVIQLVKDLNLGSVQEVLDLLRLAGVDTSAEGFGLTSKVDVATVATLMQLSCVAPRKGVSGSAVYRGNSVHKGVPRTVPELVRELGVDLDMVWWLLKKANFDTRDFRGDIRWLKVDGATVAKMYQILTGDS